MKRLFILLIGLGVLTSQAHAQVASYFSKGRTRLSLSAGYGASSHGDYLVLGGGAGYYLMDGLEAGVDGEAWLGDKPHIYSVSPGLRYVFTKVERFKPYIGAFYKQTFFDDYESTGAAGGRAGLITAINERTYLAGGAVVEQIFDCNDNIYDSCTNVYPEIAIVFAF